MACNSNGITSGFFISACGAFFVSRQEVWQELRGVDGQNRLMHTLFSFRRCPYAMRARLALRLANIEVQIQEIELRNRPPELYAVSTKGTVPVLVLDDGTVIDESLEIVKWAMDVDEHDIGLVTECDGEFKNDLDRYKYSTRYEDTDPVKSRSSGSKFLFKLNDILTKCACLSGDRFGAADICIAPFVRQFRIADMQWFDEQPWSALNEWLQTYLESDDFKAIMVKEQS